MKQEQVSKTSSTKKESFEFKEKFESIQSKPVTREVRLVFRSCCGCGCSDVNVLRQVPYDSPLKDGERITSTQKGDRTI